MSSTVALSRKAVGRCLFGWAGSLAAVRTKSRYWPLYFWVIATCAALIFVHSAWAAVDPAGANDLIRARELIVDPSAKLTIADVAALPGTPIGPVYSGFSTNSAIWMRLHVQPSASGGKVVLYIRPPYLNEIRFWESGPGDPSTWKTRVAGSFYPLNQRDRAGISLSFVVDVPAAGGTYYLRVKTRSHSGFSVEALEPGEADRRDHQRDLLIVFFGTAMFALFLWALHTYLLDRQPVVGLFAIHQAAYTTFGIAVTGYLAPLVPERFPHLIDWLDLVLYCSIGFTLTLFCRELFKVYEPSRGLMRGMKLLAWAYPLALSTIVFGYDTFAVNASSILHRISLPYFVLVAFCLRVESAPRRRLLRVSFVLILCVNVAFWFANRNSSAASTAILSAMQLLLVDGFGIGALFAMILHTRARQERLEAQQAALELIMVQKKFELEQELKKQAEIQAQTDYLTGLYNRRRFVEAAEQEVQRAVRFNRPLTLLMIDLDHFKVVNDTWGHSVGDVVLKNVAQLIRDTLRNADILGRTGGEEFAAVLVEAEDGDAIQAAERLCAVVADTVIVQPGSGRVKVTLSIGLAQLKGRSMEFIKLLDEADQAMYSVKQSGRNGVAIA